MRRHRNKAKERMDQMREKMPNGRPEFRHKGGRRKKRRKGMG